jgi:hypothetical protein
VHTEIASKYPNARVTHDARRPGKLSGAARQIDVLIEETVHGEILTTVVDAKQYSRPLDVTDVEAFLGLLRDVEAPRGIMVSARATRRQPWPAPSAMMWTSTLRSAA